MSSAVSDVVAFVAAVALLPVLLRLAWGSRHGGARVTFRFRVPLRHRYPRLWWSAVLFGLVVVLPVGWLGSSCGWWAS